MRDALKKKLGGVVTNAMQDTNDVNERLRRISEANKKPQKEIVVGQDGSLIQSHKKGLEQFAHLEDLQSIEEIESALDELSDHMNKKIHSLHAQDNVELE